MADIENQQQRPQPKIPYDPFEFGLEPDKSEIDEAIVVMSEGDLKLFLSEWGLSSIERQYNASQIDTEDFYNFRDQLFDDIVRRRQELGLSERPNYPTS